jgi:hypothetical protein
LEDRLADIDPAIVILAFLSDDLNPERAHNHVDRFGYLTKNAFGAASYWQDLMRAVLRRTHVALLAKEAFLNLGMSPATDTAAATDADADPLLARFRRSLRRFDELTAGRVRIVMCVDLIDTALTRRIRGIMAAEFPGLTYLHAPPAFDHRPQRELRVPGDGHPNAIAHQIYADLLAPSVTAAAQVLTREPLETTTTQYVRRAAAPTRTDGH